MNHLPGLRASLVQAARERYAETAAPRTRRAALRRRIPGGAIATAFAAAVALAVAVVAIMTLAHRHANHRTASSSPDTQLMVRRDAARTLRQVVLPPGAVPSGLVRGTPAELWSPYDRLAVPNRVDLYRVWRLRETPDRVLKFIAAHPPKGGLSFGWGESGSSGRGGQSRVLSASTVITFPATGTGVWREVAIDAVALRGGGTALRVDSEAGWRAPRPADARIPRGVSRVAVEWSRVMPSHQLYGGTTITNQRQVQAFVAVLNGLPLARTGSRRCKGASAVIRLVLTARASKAPLAVAVWNPSCPNLGLTIAGHSEIQLIARYPSSSVGPQIGQLLAVALLPARRVSSARAGATTVNSSTCQAPAPSAASQSGHGAAGGSCASASRSRTTASSP